MNMPPSRIHVFDQSSMGPRLFRRGNAANLKPPVGHIIKSSMGPRLFRRGNGRTDGRRFLLPRLFNGATSFQTWKYKGVTHIGDKPPSSMGPRLFRRGNLVTAGATKEDAQSLQWGHVFSDVEMSLSLSFTQSITFLQWGHVFSDVEIRDQQLYQSCFQESSMGPRLFRRGNNRPRSS